MGSMPAIIILYFQGMTHFDLFVKYLAPSDEVTYYFAALCIIQILIYLFIVNTSTQSMEPRDKLFNLYSFWGQVGFTLHGVYRVILGVSGVVLIVTMTMTDTEFWSFILSKGGFVIFVFLIGSVMLSILQTKTTLNKGWIS
jgi:hypothetical protein